MNKQSLYMFGGALLATTSLSTASHAGLIKTTSAIAGNVAPTVATFGYGLATQVFSTSTPTANAQTLGAGSATANNTILIDYTASLSSGFNVQLDISNAVFGSGTTVVTHYTASATTTTTTGSLRVLTSVTGCTVQPLTDKILINNCDPSSGTLAAGGSFGTLGSHSDALAISGLVYTSAAALATAGQAITLSGIIRNSNNTVTYDNITPVAIVTSKSAADTTIQAGGALTIDNTATPAFSKVYVTSAGSANASTTATLGTIKFSATSAVGTDLSVTFTSATSLASTTEVKIAHSILADPALVSISFSGSSKTAGQFVSGTASFTVGGSSLANAAITVTFNGSTAIEAASTTASATVTSTAAAGLGQPLAAYSGALATFTRGGMSIELNTVMPSAGVGSTTYKSVIRITNSSSFDGVATIAVKNDTTGAVIGSFTTAALTSAISSGALGAGGVIKAGGTFQLFSTDIEANVTGAAAAAAPYKVTITGSFNGYAQNLLWNTVSGVFTDLSGFRNGALTLDP
jgi:hypothetical protein